MRCVVPSCDHDTTSASCIDITFFTFPMEPSLRTAWVEVLHKASLEPNEDSVICSDHFRAEDLLKYDGGLQELRAGAMPVMDLQVCRICFFTKSKLYAITAYKDLYEAYESLMGLSTETIVNYPPYLCSECANQVLNCSRFRDKTLRAHSILLEFYQHDSITVESIKSISELLNPSKSDSNYNESDQCELNIEIMEKHDNITKLGESNTLEGIKMKVEELVIEESACVDLVRAQFKKAGNYIQSKNDEKHIVIKDSVSNDGAIVGSSLREGTVDNEVRTESGKAIVQYVPREADTSKEVDSVAISNLNNETISGVVQAKSRSEEAEHNNVGKQGARYVNSITIYKTHEGTFRCRLNTKNHEEIKHSVNKEDIGTEVQNSNGEEIEQNIVRKENASNFDSTTISNSHEGTACYRLQTQNIDNMEHGIVRESCAGSVGSIISSICEDTVGDKVRSESDEIDQHIVRKESAGNFDSIPISNSHEGIANFRIKSEKIEDMDMEYGIVREKGDDNVDSIAPCSLDEKITNNGMKMEDSEEVEAYVILEEDDCNVGSFTKCSSPSDHVMSNDGDVNQNRIKKDPTNDEMESRIVSVGEASSLDASARPGGGNQTTTAGKNNKDEFTDTKVKTDQISEELLINDKLTCDICPYKTASDVQLLAHLKAHAAVKSYDCKICSYKTVQNASLQMHMLKHTDKKPHVCDVCNKSFRRESHLKMHSRIHSGEKSYVCDCCESAFSRRQELQSHLLTHSGEYVYTCNVCKKSFTRKYHLVSHLRVHSGEKPHPCEICKKSFARKDDLQNHLLTHSGEKPYSCDVCGKAYSHKRNLQDHMVLHSEEKPYSCSLCEMAFRHQHNLKFHLLKHSGEKPHSCTICKKTFIRKDSLRAHLFTHSGEKPYSCSVCNKSFGLKCNLKKHKEMHTDKTFSCSICKKEYRKSSSLQNHLKSHLNLQNVSVSNVSIKEIIIL